MYRKFKSSSLIQANRKLERTKTREVTFNRNQYVFSSLPIIGTSKILLPEMRTHVCRIILFSVADRIYKKLNRYQNYHQTYVHTYIEFTIQTFSPNNNNNNNNNNTSHIWFSTISRRDFRVTTISSAVNIIFFILVFWYRICSLKKKDIEITNILILLQLR